MTWRFRSKDVVVEVEQHANAAPGYVRGYRLIIRDEVTGWVSKPVDIGLEKRGHDADFEAILRMGVTVIGGDDTPTSIDALYTREARDCAVKLIGFAVGQGKVPEERINLRNGEPAVTRITDEGQAMNGLGSGGGSTARSTTKDRVWPRMVMSLLHDDGLRILAKPAKRIYLLAAFREPEVVPVGPQMRPYLRWQLTKRETRALVRFLEEQGGVDASRLVAAIAKAQAAGGLRGCTC